MPKKVSTTGSELFIVDNSDTDWKVLRYLHDWCQIAKGMDIATGYFEIGALLALKDEWQKVDEIRILRGDEVSLRTKDAFNKGLAKAMQVLDSSIEKEKHANDFLEGVPAIVEALQSGKIKCRVYRKDKFHAKCYITHGRLEVVGSTALVGSSNLTYPGLTENIELNVQITGAPVKVLQEWYEAHWSNAEDVTAEVLKVIERHVHEYTPFDVYSKSLHELFLDATPGEQKWETTESRMFKELDGYQQDGYRNMMGIGREFGGALLCDGVGLGKTYVGLMLIERLILRDKLNVVLLAPKGAIDSVWKPAIARYLKKLSGGAFSNLFIASHTDLGRPKSRELFDAARDRAHAIIIDEAHHFRNPGAAGTGVGFMDAPKKALEPTLFTAVRRSRYRELSDLIPSPNGRRKELFLLTATPINNSFHDLRHMIELFTQKQEDHFAKRLGIHSVTAHFKKMESRLDGDGEAEAEPSLFTDSEEAKKILAADPLVSALVVQRSRSFVKAKQAKAGAPVTAFPPREAPRRADYSLRKVYGRLLEILETAFAKGRPLFSLPMYYPLYYYNGPSKDIDPGDENRQEAVVALIRTGFLKRFESSVEAFRGSCERLLIKLLGWITANVEAESEKQALADWRQTHIKLVEAIKASQPNLFADGDEDGDEADEDIAEDEFTQSFEKLKRAEYDVARMVAESFEDLDQLVEFFAELDKFDHRNDDKLKALLKLLKDDPALSTGKVLIFTEFADTADYLLKRLTASKITGVERIDSRTSGKNRLAVIRRFSPYYNNSSSRLLKEAGESEIRVLISTDVLSEGLNLQDAARLINYDLHWNPVRLMQRIGRVDRRRNMELEADLSADHPKQAETRKSIVFYNFLPPGELNELLSLYNRVTRKTLRISKALGIEGRKLLHEDDDYQDLQHFNESYEGKQSAMELLELERDDLFKADPDLKERLGRMPLRIFSGKTHPTPGTRAIFFCYRLPALKEDEWTTQGGPCRWILADLAGGILLDEPTQIVEFIRCMPLTPRVVVIDPPALADVRKKIEKLFKDTYYKSLQAPPDVRPLLLAWMELN